MSRPFYAEVADGIFHVTSRGNARRTIYFDDADYRRFCSEMQCNVRRHRWRFLSYCLMPNHFHLLVQTPEPNLADGMRDLKSEYARNRNRRGGVDGHLFKTGFHRQLVQSDSYLIAAAAYIARNPVRAGLCEQASDWSWSSFGSGPAFADDRPILEGFGSEPRRARQSFIDLVEGVAPAFDPSLPIVGDDEFVTRHAPAVRPPHEVVKRAWEQARPSLRELSLGCSKSELIRRARHDHHYTIKAIAAHLGCSPETVRRSLRVWDV